MATRELRSTERVRVDADTDEFAGEITWEPGKSLFWYAMGAAGLAAIPFSNATDWLVFLILTGATILAGHSVGMHRLLVHRSFKTPSYLEYALVYLGVLVGMAGPIGMIKLHDMRDWQQRQARCPAYPSHGAGFWRDAYWQLHCRFTLRHPPRFVLESEVSGNPFYQWLERTWMWQQVPIAAVLYAIGGLSMVGIGIGLRVFVSLTGHWMVGHFAHRRGQQRWVVDDLPVQGYNLPYLGWITFGENWHGNHHAFPDSALLGVEAHQSDPGFAFVRLLQWLGLAWDIQLPDSCETRDGLRDLQGSSSGMSTRQESRGARQDRISQTGKQGRHCSRVA